MWMVSSAIGGARRWGVSALAIGGVCVGAARLRPSLECAERALRLELCTPRAGELEVLADLPERLRIGVGVVNPKSANVELADAG